MPAPTGPEPSAPDLVLDCAGMRCPVPVIQLAHRITEVPIGGLVEVRADDPAAALDIPAWCRMRDQGYEGEQAYVGSLRGYRVRRRS